MPKASLLQFISQSQLENGGFMSLSSTQANFHAPVRYETVFTTAQILSCQAVPAAVRAKAAKYLLSQVGEAGSLNYWPRASIQSKQKPYPDDLDDTFCAWSALLNYQANLASGAEVAKLAKLLIQVEEQPGGPYRTWLVAKNAVPAWKDIDLAVNANVAYFLSLEGVVLPNLSAYFTQALATNQLRSPYYPTAFPLFYFLARALPSTLKPQLAKRLLSIQTAEGSFGNVLDTSLALLALIHCQVPTVRLKPIQRWLEQHEHEVVKPYPFCFDPAIEGQPAYSGAPALTAAFYLEAITQAKQVGKPQPVPHEKVAKQLKTKIIKQFKGLIGEAAQPVLNRILKDNIGDQVILLPYYGSLSFGLSLDLGVVQQLGLGSLCGWVGYTIYDDFLDEEGDPGQLGVANMCLRRLTEIYQDLNLAALYHQTLDQMDAANLWELQHCRFPITENQLQLPKQLPDLANYANLANRSLGHALCLAAMLTLTKQESAIPPVWELMQHYLIARQLMDDMHDWKPDLERGQLNSVGVAVIQRWRQQNPGSKSTLQLEQLPMLRKIFWEEVVDDICSIMTEHLQAAERIIQATAAIQEKAYLLGMLRPLQEGVALTLQERDKAFAFKATFKVPI